MKGPAVFITHFQSAIRIGRVYQVLPSGYFFPKFDGRLNLMATFFAFPPFTRKLMKRPAIFMTYFQIFYHDLHFQKNLSSGNLF